jgi:prolyl oligopeptidase
VSQNPVTDMLRFHKFTMGHTYKSDYGCSETNGDVEFLLKYSPLHNIKSQRYPPILVLTADNEFRVVPLHTYKYVAELQHVAGAV